MINNRAYKSTKLFIKVKNLAYKSILSIPEQRENALFRSRKFRLKVEYDCQNIEID